MTILLSNNNDIVLIVRISLFRCRGSVRKYIQQTDLKMNESTMIVGDEMIWQRKNELSTYHVINLVTSLTIIKIFLVIVDLMWHAC